MKKMETLLETPGFSKKAALNCVQLAFFPQKGKKAQEFPGWFVILGLILGLLILAFLIWLSVKSGQKSADVLTQIP